MEVPMKCPRYESLLGDSKNSRPGAPQRATRVPKGHDRDEETRVSGAESSDSQKACRDLRDEDKCCGNVNLAHSDLELPGQPPHAAQHVHETYHLNKQMKSYWTLWELESGVGHTLETSLHLSG